MITLKYLSYVFVIFFEIKALRLEKFIRIQRREYSIKTLYSVYILEEKSITILS